MNLNNERPLDMVEFDINLTNQEEKNLIEYAKREMLKDDSALINWAVNDILRKMVESMDNNPIKIDKMLKNKLLKKSITKKVENK